MANIEDGMDGPQWPAEWKTGWFTFRYSDITGKSPIGPTAKVTVTNSAKRAVAKNSHTTVYGGELVVPIDNGVPGGPDAQENSAGVMCIEFPIGTDPDVIPTQMKIVAHEAFTGSTIYDTLTEEHTLDNPLWLTDDLTTVRGQAGVIEAKIFFLADEDTPVPANATEGDVLVYPGNPPQIFQLKNA